MSQSFVSDNNNIVFHSLIIFPFHIYNLIFKPPFHIYLYNMHQSVDLY